MEIKIVREVDSMAEPAERFGEEYQKTFEALDYEPFRLIRTFTRYLLPPLKILVVSAPTKNRQVVTFKNRGDSVTFVDISPYAVKLGSKFGKVIEADVRELPFENSAYDIAICRYLFEHYPLSDVSTMINELLRVVSHWLIVGVSTTNVRPERLKADPTHVTFMSFEEWTKFFKTFPQFTVVSSVKDKEVWLLKKNFGALSFGR